MVAGRRARSSSRGSLGGAGADTLPDAGIPAAPSHGQAVARSVDAEDAARARPSRCGSLDGQAAGPELLVQHLRCRAGRRCPTSSRCTSEVGDRVRFVGVNPRDSGRPGPGLRRRTRRHLRAPARPRRPGRPSALGIARFPTTVFVGRRRHHRGHQGRRALSADELRKPRSTSAHPLVIDGAFALAFTAGMLATVNPCGFAMLPAYLSYFLGIESHAGSTSRRRRASAGRWWSAPRCRPASWPSSPSLGVRDPRRRRRRGRRHPLPHHRHRLRAHRARHRHAARATGCRSPRRSSTAADATARSGRCSCSASPTPSPRSAARSARSS